MYTPPVRSLQASLAILIGLLCSTAASEAQSVSIMPLGDSLTWGYDGGPDTPAYLDSLDTGGYRSPLYSLLTSDGIQTTYVGVGNGNPSPVLTAAGQTAQNGFNGYRIDDIANNLAGSVAGSDGVSNLGGYWLTGGGGTNRGPETPDIILLQIGANDLEQEYDPLFTGTPGTETASQLAADTATRLGTLITDIRDYEPQATIITDGTPVLINSNFETAASSDYETDVQSLVASEFPSENVYYFNMAHALAPGGFAAYEGDGIHLTASGYQLMADGWDDAIMADYNFNAEPADVPEPSTYALFIAGAIALAGWRRLRKSPQ